MRAAYVAGVARAQRVAREAILEVASTVGPGDTERELVLRVERELAKARVEHWLHTPYAWFGERTCFDWRGTWETEALASDRVLQAGEPFILDVAPIVAGYPADFAYSGLAGSAPDAASRERHGALLTQLDALKSALVTWAAPGTAISSVCAEVERAIGDAELDTVHTRYPGNVLGHTLEGFPNFSSSAPRIGSGFQLPLLVTYGLGLMFHQLAGTRYPFLSARAPGHAQGLYAVEPHLGKRGVGAKFESVLLVDGTETRWLDPGLFGEVVG